MKILSIRNVKEIAKKRILLRVDFNVPICGSKIKDETKIIKSLPTIKFLRRYGCKIIILSHLGRPKGKKDKLLSLKPVALCLSKMLGQKINFIEDYNGNKTNNVILKMKEKEIVMFENLRFYKEEIDNDLKFAKNLSCFADLYINNAFAVSHRKHASVSAIKKFLPSYAGLLLEQEIIHLNKILKPDLPFIAIIGGAKIATKINLIDKLIKQNKNQVKILVGGTLANLFLQARGYEIGKSFVDVNYLKMAKRFKKENIILPIDFIVSKYGNKKNNPKIKNLNNISKNEIIYDIGPETIKMYAQFIKKAKMLVWNGPLGLFEKNAFKHGSLSIAKVIAICSQRKMFAVVGGGETNEVLRLSKMQNYINWISTGGGSMLAYLSGAKMPGLNGIIK